MYAHAFPIRVPSDVLEALGAFTGHFWSDSLRLEPYVCEAIRNYINQAPTTSAPAAPPQEQPTPSQSQAQPLPAAQSELGYQWKEVFLPEGTRLRASFGRTPYFATVEGSEIKYGEHAVSPSCFANLYGSGNRNAWKAVWLRLPGKDMWVLADLYRAGRKTALARWLTDDTRDDSRPACGTASGATVEGEDARQSMRPAARLSTQPAARQPVPGPTEARPPGLPAAHGGAQAGAVAGKRARRRKRRAKKPSPASH